MSETNRQIPKSECEGCKDLPEGEVIKGHDHRVDLTEVIDRVPNKPVEPEPHVMDESFTINVKNDHTSGKGIYAVSEPVKSYKQVKDIVEKMLHWLYVNNGHFPKPYPVAYAVSHCQVEMEKPYAFFVIHKDMLGGRKMKQGKNTAKNYYFQSPVIFNAQILEAPAKIPAKIPSRELVKNEKGKMTGSKIVIKEGEVHNLIPLPEACLSFLHRKQKNKDRYYRVKVRYWELAHFLGIAYLKRRTEWVEGLKAHIFQHEIDHAKGKNIYYDK